MENKIKTIYEKLKFKSSFQYLAKISIMWVLRTLNGTKTLQFAFVFAKIMWYLNIKKEQFEALMFCLSSNFFNIFGGQLKTTES